MTRSTTLTSKGQMTLPAAFRKKLGVKPGERVILEIQGEKVIIQKDNWRENLAKVQKENQIYLQSQGIKPLTDKELDDAINTAAEQAVLERYKHSLE